MKILLIDIDSKKLPNLALHKIERYHIDRGDEVIWNYELDKYSADKIYVSCVFTWNRDKCKEWEGIATIGGSGYDIAKTLPKKIERIKPKINIGFTSRGCIRRCPFCIVPDKEGIIRRVAEIPDIWDGESKDITLLDNNILALPDHFELIYSQLLEREIRVDFNQGLDIRLLNDTNTSMLSHISHKEYKFAFDFIEHEGSVIRGIKLLKKHGINRSTFYVLTGYDTTYGQDLYRLSLLRNLGQRAYVQRFNYKKDRILSIFARWANQHNMFATHSFKEFVMLPKHKSYVKICKEAGLI